jgi:N-acetylglucosaminyldiphosphoundecaprenol N-acetyl-beta-D-mannosaminyltransferase
MNPPDFSRNVCCLFGLPFDVIALEEAVERVHSAARTGERCFISTPNMNFVVAARSDPEFRDSVIRSDLSLVDGMPLVWTGRAMGIPFPERLAGASLFERLRKTRVDPPLKAYLFGGDAGVAERAAAVLNKENGGVRCVGYASPGYGSVESMSAPAVIEDINSSGADFLLVALGARKGQAWIERNLPRLRPPVVCHLGAVINFIAGTAPRAPGWLQVSGFEWLWRIAVEPPLWRRYAGDGRKALGLYLDKVVPGLIVHHLDRWTAGAARASLSVQETGTEIVIALKGAWPSTSLSPLRNALNCHAETAKRLRVDLREARFVDAALIALILLVRRYRLDQGRDWRLEPVPLHLARAFRAYGADVEADR